MSIEASQSTSQPIKLTAKQQLADTACQKCGTFVRNFISRACVECDRIRALKAYRAKHPNAGQRSKQMAVPEKVSKENLPKTVKQPVNPNHVHLQIAKPEINNRSPLSQPVTQADRDAISQRLQADYEAFMANGGKVKQGGTR